MNKFVSKGGQSCYMSETSKIGNRKKILVIKIGNTLHPKLEHGLKK